MKKKMLFGIVILLAATAVSVIAVNTYNNSNRVPATSTSVTSTDNATPATAVSDANTGNTCTGTGATCPHDADKCTAPAGSNCPNTANCPPSKCQNGEKSTSSQI